MIRQQEKVKCDPYSPRACGEQFNEGDVQGIMKGYDRGM